MPMHSTALIRRDTAPIIKAFDVKDTYKPKATAYVQYEAYAKSHQMPRHKKKKRRKKKLFAAQTDDCKTQEKEKEKRNNRPKATSFFTVRKEEIDKIKSMKNRTPKKKPAAVNPKQKNDDSDLMSSQVSQTKDSSNMTDHKNCNQ
eukprot:UN10764